MKNIIHFIQYNNFFTLAVALTLVGTGSAFAASPELLQTADNALVGKTETVVFAGNSDLLNLDAESFDPQVTITATTEDSDSYYISYSFTTFEVTNGTWGKTEKTGTLAIPKNALASTDLREYAEKQLREIAQKEIAFLKEAKALEAKKGEQKTTVVVAYTGLLGLIIAPKEKEPESVVDAPVMLPEIVSVASEPSVIPQNIEPATVVPETVTAPVVEESVSVVPAGQEVISETEVSVVDTETPAQEKETVTDKIDTP